MHRIFLLSVLTALATWACSDDTGRSSDKAPMTSTVVSEESRPASTDPDGGPDEGDATIQPKRIKTGAISVWTADLQTHRARLVSLTTGWGGYVSDEHEDQSGDRRELTLTLRIPAQHFDALMDSVAVGVDRISNRWVSVRDVTEEYIDVQSRLEAKRALEQRYLALLDEAATVQEMLDIERELADVRQAIESARGRLNYLDDQVALSTLTVTLTTDRSSAPTGFVQSMGESLADGWRNFKRFAIEVMGLWPFLTLLVVVIWLVRRWRKRRRR